MDEQLKKVARKRVNKLQLYQTVFSTKDGQDVLYDLMKFCNMLQPVYSGDTTDAIYRDGQRSVALYILSVIKEDYRKLHDRIDREVKNEHDYE